MSLSLVAIVGRPNVGKSSLFNRIVGQRLAVVDDRPGVTRDRHLTVAEWAGRDFFLVDTGGFLPSAKAGQLEAAVRRQAEIAIEEAHVVLLVVDASTGPTDLDQDLAARVRKKNRAAVLVVNKMDRPGHDDPRAAEFHRLGLGEPWSVSAAQGYGIGDLLDHVIELLPEETGEAELDGTRVALVGRPNVGKSSLVNALLGEERMVVHSAPGTTVDSVDSRLERAGRPYVLVDTAGIRRESRYEDDAEFFATLRSARAIERAEVVTVVLEATRGIVRQDLRIIESVLEAGRPALLAYNKWDLIEHREERWKELEEEQRKDHPWLADIPGFPCSATSRWHLDRLPQFWTQLAEETRRKVTTPELNRWLEDVQNERQAPSTRLGRPARIYYATQTGSKPPRFTVFASQPEAINASYHRFLLNRLRERFGFTGTPVKLEVKKSK
ncbi:MAG TPA: ribosome biogenesis GTPase Der [Candidatus Eisenbacteria bacterium]|nr:ribosome biogenesis GTPase Der [Candidatus Eisenbacteria bacterium]